MTILYDQFGREMQIGKKPEMREIAVAAVRDRWSTYPSKGLTPERLASILREADGGDVYRQAELFEEMEEKDTHLASEFQTRKNAVLGLDYDLQPFSESSEDKKIRDFVSEILLGLQTLEEIFLDLLDAIAKGYSLAEILWSPDGGKVVISDLRWIHAKRASFWQYAASPWQRLLAAPRITTEANPIQGEEMPPFKLVYHRYKARSGHDTRAGIMRTCTWMYLFKNYAIKDWVAFAEIFGMPLRLGKYDPGYPGDKEALMDAVRMLASDSAAVISNKSEIEFVETMKNTGSASIHELLASFCNSEMSKAILGQTLTTQEGKSGSYSLGQVHDRVRRDLTAADHEALSRTVRAQIIRPLVGFNFGWDKKLPWFKFLFEEAEDLKMLSEVYRNLRAIRQPISQEHVAERFKIPLPKEGEIPLPDPAPGIGAPIAAKEKFARIVSAGRDVPQALDNSMEARRQQMVNHYLSQLGQSLGGAREKALQEVDELLRRSSGISEEDFSSGVIKILRRNYGQIPEESIRRAVTPIYTFYRLTDRSIWPQGASPVATAFDGADTAALAAVRNIDSFYLSSMIENQDMQGSVMNFLKEKYLQDREGLFGAGNPEVLSEFRAQFGDKLSGLEDWQVQRIVDTSVTRIRSLADVRQGAEAGSNMEVFVTRRDLACPICQAHSGEIVEAQGMLNEMLRAAQTPAAFGTFNRVPPFHPNCVCRLIAAIEKKV